ncbi:hypothetical protein [Nonomuraea sp. B1E8]|uniref:hypothetical protein n=1 Tax=unclassified Nonomuraea TaxID=2593643 RepID=UPI00325F80AD
MTGVAQAVSGLMPGLWTFAALMLPIAAVALARLSGRTIRQAAGLRPRLENA